MANTVTNTELDNIINRLNKKLDRVRATLGADSQLYGHMTSTLNILRPLGLVNRTGRNYSIKRGKAVSNLSTKQKQSLKDKLDRVEAQYNANSLSKEKARLKREIINDMRRANGKTGRVTYSEYREAEAMSRVASTAFDKAVAYFYNNQDGPEYAEALKILHIKGRRKTFAEERRLTMLASKHAHRKYGKFAQQNLDAYGLSSDMIQRLSFLGGVI